MKQPVPVSPVAKATIRNGSKRAVPVIVIAPNDLAMGVLNSILDDDPAILRIRAEGIGDRRNVFWYFSLPWLV
jgi:hypothetical protein